MEVDPEKDGRISVIGGDSRFDSIANDRLGGRASFWVEPNLELSACSCRNNGCKAQNQRRFAAETAHLGQRGRHNPAASRISGRSDENWDEIWEERKWSNPTCNWRRSEPSWCKRYWWRRWGRYDNNSMGSVLSGGLEMCPMMPDICPTLQLRPARVRVGWLDVRRGFWRVSVGWGCEARGKTLRSTAMLTSKGGDSGNRKKGKEIINRDHT